MGIMGFYALLFFTVPKIMSIGSKKKVAAPVAAPVKEAESGDSMPAFDSPLFDTWISAPGNLEKYIVS